MYKMLSLMFIKKLMKWKLCFLVLIDLYVEMVILYCILFGVVDESFLFSMIRKINFVICLLNLFGFLNNLCFFF